MSNTKENLVETLEQSLILQGVDGDVITQAISTALGQGCDYIQVYGDRNVTAWAPDGSKGWNICDRRYLSGGLAGGLTVVELDSEGFPVA